MPLQATSGAASYDGFGGGVAAVPQYIEDVFSTYLYKGNSLTQTITNGIDLSTKGGLVWIKSRDTTFDHMVFDTSRGASNYLNTNNTTAQSTNIYQLSSFDTSGFTLGDGNFTNNSTYNYASWTFRKQPKFFDVVTWTSTNSASARISHNLESVPGCYIIKRTNGVGTWFVYHTSLGRSAYLTLNTTTASQSITNCWGTTGPTSTDFGVDETVFTGGAGQTFVAYLFAHNAGGFGLTGTDNVISCGSAANGNSLVTLGYEPQWVLIKGSQGSTAVGDDWLIVDTMRGMVYSGNTPYLAANKASAEDYGGAGGAFIKPTATGFQLSGLSGTGPFIYIAIRRGPMKVPTDATKVFSPNAHIGTEPTRKVITAGFPVDLSIQAYRNLGGAAYFGFTDRLRGGTQYLVPYNTSAEGASASPDNFLFDANTTLTSGQGAWNNTNANGLSFNLLRRAPSFFDEVCYTGTGVARTVAHNLTVAPEMIITKNRSGPSDNWLVFTQPTGNSGVLVLQNTDALYTPYFDWVPTSTTFSVAAQSFSVNDSGVNYVAYLFATCAGVSKVGSYTGNGTTQTINCGFTAGARFVLIKRTDSTGNWYVYDTARGMTTVTDPYLWLNSTAAEVATLGSVTTVATGFALNSAIVAAINVSAGTYIFLAIA